MKAGGCSPCRAGHEGAPAAGLGSRWKIFRTYPKDQIWARSLENAGSAWTHWVMRANLPYNMDSPFTAMVTNSRKTFPNRLRLQYSIVASIIRPVSFPPPFSDPPADRNLQNLAALKQWLHCRTGGVRPVTTTKGGEGHSKRKSPRFPQAGAFH